MTAAHIEKRRHVRASSRIAATVVVNHGVTRLEATIVNVSQSGAKLEIADAAELSDTFYMLIPEHQLQPCRVVWRDAQFAGVCYVV